jgi:hypothetical protein
MHLHSVTVFAIFDETGQKEDDSAPDGSLSRNFRNHDHSWKHAADGVRGVRALVARLSRPRRNGRILQLQPCLTTLYT